VKESIREKIRETKRQLILEAVADFFETQGFNGVKMQEIAKALGISVGALYKLFPSKEALFYAYVSFEIETFHRRLLEQCPPDRSDPMRCLRRYIRLKFDTLASKRKALEDPVVGDPLFFMKMNTRQQDPAAPIFDYLTNLFEELGKTVPLKETNPRKIAYLFNAFTTGYVEYWIHYQEGLDDAEERVLDLFLEGMAQR